VRFAAVAGRRTPHQKEQSCHIAKTVSRLESPECPPIQNNAPPGKACTNTMAMAMVDIDSPKAKAKA
jgi:hypothetical protein